MTTAMQTRIHIRWMVRRDLAEVLAIDAASFGPDCWGEEDWLRSLRQNNVIAMVAEHGEQVVGVMLYDISSNKKLTLARFAVHPEWRRRGVGRQMLDKLKSKLSGHRRTRLVIDVPETLVAGQIFFRSCGLRVVKIVRGQHGGPDLYRMEYRLPPESPASLWLGSEVEQ